jgi:ABC-type antimicrobial peptide transport system permease subunit
MLGAFATSALVLATLGLFGLVSYTTSQRTRELGLRVALGATPADVVRQVVEGGMRMLGIGLAVGLVLSLAMGRALAARVHGIGSFDLLVFVGVPLVLGLAGVLACLMPAVRAVRIPAAVALRYE